MRRLERSASTSSSGTSKRNVLPRPGSDAALSSPPMIETSRREIASPRPVPPKRRVVEVSAWVNGSNSCARCSRSMPIPVSRTCTRSRAEASPARFASARTDTSPESVNLIALASRFVRICRRRCSSPRSVPGTESAMKSVSSTPLACASGASIAPVESTTSRGSNGRSSRSSLPASIFEKSSTSLMTFSSASPELTAVSTSDRCSSLSGVSPSSSSMPITPLSGVRISWLMLATKSDLASDAARAWASARLRSEMSVATEPTA